MEDFLHLVSIFYLASISLVQNLLCLIKPWHSKEKLDSYQIEWMEGLIFKVNFMAWMLACEAQTYFRWSLHSLRREGEKRRPEIRLRFAGYLHADERFDVLPVWKMMEWPFLAGLCDWEKPLFICSRWQRAEVWRKRTNRARKETDPNLTQSVAGLLVICSPSQQQRD